MTAEAVIVTGFLGAGKSCVVRGIQALGHDAREMPGLQAPGATMGGQSARVIAVVDGANAKRHLSDPLIAPLVTRQIASAGLVIVSRGDLAGVSDVVSEVSAMTSAPVVDVVQGAIETTQIDALMPQALADPQPEDDLTEAFETWHYSGPVTLRQDHAELLVAERPDGIERVAGIVRTKNGGVELQVAGRLRQTLDVARPAQTELSVIWPKGTVRRSDMDLWFTEAVVDSGHRRGLFGYF